MISIITPTLNEADRIASTLEPLQRFRGPSTEIIVVDGGSSDATQEIAQTLADQVLTSRKGRAQQMNAGAAKAEGELLLFLHADTSIPALSFNRLQELSKSEKTLWGRFDVQPDRRRMVFRTITSLMNWRSCISGIVTGDQAMFVKRSVFEEIGGFPDIALMEDIALSRLLRTRQKPACVSPPVTIAMRYWEQHGIIRSIVRMWQLRLAYFFNAPPEQLHRRYYRD